MSYDVKCHAIAGDFLEDHPKLNTAANIKALAQTVQDAIEDWLEAHGAFEDEPKEA